MYEKCSAVVELCPELARTLHREPAQLDARIDAMQRSRGALVASLEPGRAVRPARH